MTARPPDWRTLNAYVDGELDARAAGAVAEAAGSDPAIAGEIASLYRLKGVTHDLFPPAPPDLALTLSRSARRRWRLAGIAAAALVAAVALAALWAGLGSERRALPADVLTTARALHSEWLSTQSGEAGEESPTLMSALGHFRQVPVVPDLESARLTITRVRLAEWAGGPVLQVGYRGIHGCRLSLFVFTTAEMPEAMVRVDEGLERAYGWRSNRLGYMLLARGMDRQMLDLIARKVEEETRTHTPFDEGTRNLLAVRKRQSESCTA